MIYFSCACYVFFSFVQAKAAISSFPNELINRASGNLGFVTQDQQDPVLGDQTATPFQDSADLFDNFALNPSDSPISNLPPNNNFDSTPGRGDDGGETTSLLFDESVGGGERTGISIPSAPIQIPDGLPDVINGIRQWLSNPKKPECKENKHPLCCEKGAPSLKDGNPRSGGRRPSIPPKVIFEPLEYSQRRRVCRSWSTDALACQFPENIFCCYCQDYNSIAYFCYNQPYADLTEFKNQPIPEPRQISKPQQDPNPIEEEQPSSQKRDIGGLPINAYLYAEDTPRGRKRKPDTCTDKFLESVGVSTYRYKYPTKTNPDIKNWNDGREGWWDQNRLTP